MSEIEIWIAFTLTYEKKNIFILDNNTVKVRDDENVLCFFFLYIVWSVDGKISTLYLYKNVYTHFQDVVDVWIF